MTQPLPEELLSASVDGEHTPAEAALVQRVLSLDPEGRRLREEFALVSQWVKELPRPTAPDGLAQSVMEQIQSRAGRAADPALEHRLVADAAMASHQPAAGRSRRREWSIVGVASSISCALTILAMTSLARVDVPFMRSVGPSETVIDETGLGTVGWSENRSRFRGSNSADALAPDSLMFNAAVSSSPTSTALSASTSSLPTEATMSAFPEQARENLVRGGVLHETVTGQERMSSSADGLNQPAAAVALSDGEGDQLGRGRVKRKMTDDAADSKVGEALAAGSESSVHVVTEELSMELGVDSTMLGRSMAGRSVSQLLPGDVLPYLEVTDPQANTTACLEVTVVDVQRAAGRVQMLLLQNGIVANPSGPIDTYGFIDRFESDERLQEGPPPVTALREDELIAVYANAPRDQVAAALDGLANEDMVVQWRLLPPLNFDSAAIAVDEGPVDAERAIAAARDDPGEALAQLKVAYQQGYVQRKLSDEAKAEVAAYDLARRNESDDGLSTKEKALAELEELQQKQQVSSLAPSSPAKAVKRSVDSAPAYEPGVPGSPKDQRLERPADAGSPLPAITAVPMTAEQRQWQAPLNNGFPGNGVPGNGLQNNGFQSVVVIPVDPAALQNVANQNRFFFDQGQADLAMGDNTRESGPEANDLPNAGTPGQQDFSVQRGLQRAYWNKPPENVSVRVLLVLQPVKHLAPAKRAIR
jgi:hypothetical protein